MKNKDSGQTPVKRNRMMATSILLLPLLVVVLSTLLWLLVQRGHLDLVGMLGTHNQGVLLNPVVDIRDFELLDVQGEPFVYLEQVAKWSLLIPGSDVCDEACRQNLWLTRQLHTALGRRASYLRRYYLTDALPLSAELAEYLATEHPGLVVISASPGDLATVLVAGSMQPESAAPAFFLVDKRGYLMMVYTANNSGKDVITDLKFLMKQVGDA